MSHLATKSRHAGWLAALVLLLAGCPLTAQEAELGLVERPDPVIEAIVDSPRKEPADFLRTVFVLADLGQVSRAEPILKSLIEQQLDEPAMAALVAEFGSAKFLRLASNPAFGPDARAFVDRCMAAAATQTRSPERLDTIVKQLTAGSATERTAALVDLRTTGLPGAEFVLAELPDAAPEAQNQLRQALVAMAPISTPLLIAALDTPPESARSQALLTQAAIALGELREDQAAPMLATLVTAAPAGSTVGQAAAWSYEELTGRPFSFDRYGQEIDRGIERYLDGGPAFSPTAAGDVPLGAWDAGTNRLVMAPAPVADAGVVLAARLAAAQAAIQGDRADVVRRALVLGLESQAIHTRLGLPVRKNDALTIATPAQLNAALNDAIKENRSNAGVALCGAIANLGDSSVLLTANAKPSPLAAALDATHPAVRFAALRAVMKLNPRRPFPGSSRVVPAIEYFAAGAGDVVVIVATPNLGRSATLGGRLSPLRIRARVTNRGDEALSMACQGADVQAVLIDTAILRPHVRETVFRLRRQINSAGVPIAITAGDGRLLDAERIAADHTGVIATPRPHTAQDAGKIVEELAALLPVDWPSPSQRVVHANQARLWAESLATDGPDFYPTPRLDAPTPPDAEPVDLLPPAPAE